MTETSIASSLGSTHVAADRVLHYELSWTRFLACTIRRPSRMLVFEVAWTMLLAGILSALMMIELPVPGPVQAALDLPLNPFVIVGVLLGAGAARRLWHLLVGSWHHQGGLDRIAYVRGTELTICSDAIARTYDLSRARRARIGDHVRVASSTGRWAPDDVPAALFDGLADPAGAVTRPADPKAVVFGTQWRDGLAGVRSLAAPRPSALSAAPILILFAVAIGSTYHAGAIVVMLAAMTCFSVVMGIAVVAGTIADTYRGVVARPTALGLRLEDVDYAETLPWGRIQLADIGPGRITIDALGSLRERGANRHAFEVLQAQIREHCSLVTNSRDAQLNASWRLVAWPLRMTAAAVGVVALALLGGDPSTIVSISLWLFAVFVATFLALTVPSIVRPIVGFWVLRPPPLADAHRRDPEPERDDMVWTIRDLRFGGIVLLVAPLLVAGIVLLVADAPMVGAATAGVGMLVAIVAQQLLPDLHRETALAVAAAVACCVAGSFLILSSSGHPRMTSVVAGGVVVAIGALLAVAWTSDRQLVPAAQLGGAFVAAALLASATGAAGALHVVGASRIDDVTSAASIVAHPDIGGMSLRGVSLEDAYDDVERVAIRWVGDEPRLTSPTGMFDEDRGALAKQRITAVLREAAEEPGGRPRVREIVFTTSWYGVASNHAVNVISNSGARWPEAARSRIKEETQQNDWVSRYFGDSQRIVISRTESENLLKDLFSPPGTKLDHAQAYSFHVLRHEIEHGMSSGGVEPKWIVEATAEVLTQWVGRERGVLAAASFEASVHERKYGGDYERWGRLLYTILESCHMSPDIPARFDDAARLLRDRKRPAQEQLADCLAEQRGIERAGLTQLITDAGSKQQAADALLERLGR